MRVRFWPVILAMTVMSAVPGGLFAQIAPAPSDVTGTPADAPQSQQPAAVGEEHTKPTRGFFSALVHNLGDDMRHMPRKNSLYWLAGGGALALAVHPEDKKINARMAGHDALFKGGKYIGSTQVLLPAAFATYLIGRGTGSPRAEHLGMDEIEALLLAEGFAQGLKVAVRRKRPPELDGTQSNTYSFPSGHATLTFAGATVLQQHLGYRAAIPTYLVASWVAVSRLHDNRHYASDVVFGAAMGVMIGRSVTWHGRNFYGSPMLVPGGAGVMMAMR
jgi:membrane-associated phospholipid phosphatase